jgi:hypothetical protein
MRLWWELVIHKTHLKRPDVKATENGATEPQRAQRTE